MKKKSNPTTFSFSYFDTVCVLIILILNLIFKILISKNMSKELNIFFFFFFFFFLNFKWFGRKYDSGKKRTPLSTNRYTNKIKMMKTGFVLFCFVLFCFFFVCLFVCFLLLSFFNKNINWPIIETFALLI